MNKLTTREQNLLIIAVALALSVCGFVYVIQPTLQSYRAGKADLNKLQAELTQLKSIDSDTVKAAEDKLNAISREIPLTPATSELLSELETAAGKAGVTLVDYSEDKAGVTNSGGSGSHRAGGTEKSGEVSDNSSRTPDGTRDFYVLVTVVGSMEKVSAYLGELEKLPRLVWVARGEIDKASLDLAKYGPAMAVYQIRSFYQH